MNVKEVSDYLISKYFCYIYYDKANYYISYMYKNEQIDFYHRINMITWRSVVYKLTSFDDIDRIIELINERI